MSDYPSSLTTKPLTTWPGTLTPAGARKRSPFSAGMRQTLDLLDRELWHLNARATVLEVALPPEKFRIDGHPRAGATAEHPGVVLSLPHTSVGPLRYACDLFWTWQDNLRAIALGLEALRKVERYGITRRGEQYAGFRALPPGGPIALSEGMDVEEASRILAEGAGFSDPHAAPALVTDAESRLGAFRLAAKKHHPDVGGQRHAWDRIELAKRVLDGASS